MKCFSIVALMILVVSISACSSGQLFGPTLTATPTNTPIPTNTPTPTSIPTLTSTRTPTLTQVPTWTLIPILKSNQTPLSVSGFVAGDQPFEFLGAFVPGWYWGQWSEATDIDLIMTAKSNGITVLHLMPPEFEKQLGVYREAELVKLDHFLDIASQNGVYVMIPFIHGYGISQQPDNPYYHPAGIEGLVSNQKLRDAFRKRMEVVISRVNTVNGRKYAQDPTILAWMIVEEPISAPANYPKGSPNVTAAQLGAWVEEMASYVKSLDSNHLIAINTTSAIESIQGDWLEVFSVPSLDFVEVEDADARILGWSKMSLDVYHKIFTLGKPVVIMISFTSGALDQESICSDYTWQAEKLRDVFSSYRYMGAAGFTIFSWGSDFNITPPYDKCYSYTSSNETVGQALLDIANQLGSRNSPVVPLQFVKIRR